MKLMLCSINGMDGMIVMTSEKEEGNELEK